MWIALVAENVADILLRPVPKAPVLRHQRFADHLRGDAGPPLTTLL
jgi:hypothetical protein